MPYLLGKHPARHDTRTLRLAPYLRRTQLPAPPPTCDWTPAVRGPWGVMKNDRISNCGLAAPGHQVMLWTANASTIRVPTDQEIIAAYSAVSGYDPRTGANDNGVNMLDVLKYWQLSGIAGDVIDAYAQVDPTNLLEMQLALWLTGGLFVGARLPLIAKEQIDAGQPWDVPPGGATGNAAPGGWGGHAIEGVAYTPGGLLTITWGKVQLCTWRWIATYCDEMYATLSREWIETNGHAPNGLDLATLFDDVAQLTGAPMPSAPKPWPDVPPKPAPPAFAGAAYIQTTDSLGNILQEWAVRPV